MKRLVISLALKLIKKESTRWLLSIITAVIFAFLNWIGTFADIPYILGLFIFLMLGVVFIFIPKLFSCGKFFIVIGLSLMLFVIIKNCFKKQPLEYEEYVKSCDELVHEMFKTDSIGWKLYQERNPEILAFIGYLMLEQCLSENDVSYRLPMIKYADSLINEGLKADVAYAYLGRAYKEYYGLGCEKSVKEAVRDAQTCINMKYCPQAYSLLEQMNLDSSEYKDVVSLVHHWRDSLTKVGTDSYWVLYNTFLPSKILSLQDMIFSFNTTITDKGIHSDLDLYGYPREYEKAIRETYSLYESLYKGDTTSVAWKTVEGNMDILKRMGMPAILAAYYWGKGDVDSAHLYCDSIGGFYNTYSQFHDFCKFKYNEESFDKDIKENLFEVLHYSGMGQLNYYRYQTDDTLLYYVITAALTRRHHRMLKDNKQMNQDMYNDSLNNLNKAINNYIKKIRPNVK